MKGIQVVLERARYPTPSPGLECRPACLNTLEKTDMSDAAPIVETLCDIYRDQHGRIAEEIGQKAAGGDSRVQEENARLVRRFLTLKERA